MARSPFPGNAPIGRIDQGIDYSGSFVGPIYAVGDGTVYKVDPVGTPSWGGMGAIYYKLDKPITVNGRTYNEVYTAETSDIGVRQGQRIQQGQVIATTKSGWQETGFARNGAPIAPDVKVNGTTAPTQAGQDFLDAFNLHSSAASAGNADPNDAPSTPPAGAATGSDPNVMGARTFTPHQMAFINRLSKDTGLSREIIGAQMYVEQNINAGAPAYEAKNYNDWLNIGNTEKAVASGHLNSDPVWNDPLTAADATAAWMRGQSKAGYDFASSGIQDWFKSATSPGATPNSILQGLAASGWASGGYPLLQTTYQAITQGHGGSGTYVTGASGSTGANGGTNDTSSSGGATGTKNTRPLGPPSPTGGGLYGPPAPGSSGPQRITLSSARQPTSPAITNAILSLLKGVGGGGAHPVISAPPVHVAPVAAASAALSNAALPQTDLSPFGIGPLTPTTAVTPVPTTPNPFQIFGLRP